MLQKYATPILSFLLFLLGALRAADAAGFDRAAQIQLVVLFIGAVATFFVPLVRGPWAGAIKTGLAIIAALLVLAAPYIVQGYISNSQLILFGLAAVNAVATQLGIVIRLDAPAPSDQKAYQIVRAKGGVLRAGN